MQVNNKKMKIKFEIILDSIKIEKSYCIIRDIKRDIYHVSFSYIYDNILYENKEPFHTYYDEIPNTSRLIKDIIPFVRYYLKKTDKWRKGTETPKSDLNKSVISIFGIKLGSANKWVRRILNNPNDVKASKEIEKKKKIFIKIHN